MLISSPVAAGELQDLLLTLGSASPAQLADHAALLDRARLAVRRALATTHLVAVASQLTLAFGFDVAALATLGVPVDLLECFPAWRAGLPTPFRPGTSGLQLAASGASIPIDAIRLQLSPASGTIPYALLLLRDLLRQLDPTTRFAVVVEPGANVEALIGLVSRFHPTASERVRFVPMRCSTVFAQDNA